MLTDGDREKDIQQFQNETKEKPFNEAIRVQPQKTNVVKKELKKKTVQKDMEI